MNNKGFGLGELFAIILVVCVALIVSATYYKRFSNETDVKKESKKHVEKVELTFDYNILENNIKNAAKEYLSKQNLDKSLSLIITSKELKDNNLLKDFKDNKTECTGYVVYKNNDYIPYIWCKGNYATDGYNTNLE